MGMELYKVPAIQEEFMLILFRSILHCFLTTVEIQQMLIHYHLLPNLSHCSLIYHQCVQFHSPVSYQMEPSRRKVIFSKG